MTLPLAARPRLGVLDLNPIQYHSPLYQRLSARAVVDLRVLYLHDQGLQTVVDPEFGVPIRWDIDLLGGYAHRFLANGPGAAGPGRAAALTRWICGQDVVVIHGHSHPWMLAAGAICRARRVPYLLRGDSGPDSKADGAVRHARDALARSVVSHSGGGLAVGQRNEQFYRKYRAPRVTFAPHSVDNERFARPPETGRAALLARWGLDCHRPVLLFCGKLLPRKRPLDLLAAARLLDRDVTLLFVGDGELAATIGASLPPGRGAVTGFVHQSELPSYYHAADVLVLPSEAEPWGLVVNEAMAAGVLPVVSDRVGAAPDLVEGIGEIYPCGDVPALAAALRRALARAGTEPAAARARQHVTTFSVDRTAAGFEQAALAALGQAGPALTPVAG